MRSPHPDSPRPTAGLIVMPDVRLRRHGEPVDPVLQCIAPDKRPAFEAGMELGAALAETQDKRRLSVAWDYRRGPWLARPALFWVGLIAWTGLAVFAGMHWG